MKKKIKNLTIEEANKICNNGGKYLPCDRCPLSFGRDTALCYRDILQEIHKKKFNLDKEVEINESDND